MYSELTLYGYLFAAVIFIGGCIIFVVWLLMALMIPGYQRAKRQLLEEVARISPAQFVTLQASPGSLLSTSALEQYALVAKQNDSQDIATAKQIYLTQRRKMRRITMGLFVSIGAAMLMANLLFALALLGIIELSRSVPLSP